MRHICLPKVPVTALIICLSKSSTLYASKRSTYSRTSMVLFKRNLHHKSPIISDSNHVLILQCKSSLSNPKPYSKQKFDITFKYRPFNQLKSLVINITSLYKAWSINDVQCETSFGTRNHYWSQRFGLQNKQTTVRK